MAAVAAIAQITCAQCSNTFSVVRKRNWHNCKYCGPECALKAKQGYRSQYLREFAKRPISCADTGTKVCRTCEQEKPVTEFHKSTNYADGRQSRCRDCAKSYTAKLVAQEPPERRAARLEKHRARTNEWKRQNKDWVREYTASTREQNTERHRSWRQANPEKWAAVVRARDGRRRGGAGSLGGRVLREWTAAQKKVCHWCGAPCRKFHVDHLVPLKLGGPHELHNLCISCPTCNQRKGAKDPVDFARELGKLI